MAVATLSGSPAMVTGQKATTRVGRQITAPRWWQNMSFKIFFLILILFFKNLFQFNFYKNYSKILPSQ
jgi:hypothetical protein